MSWTLRTKPTTSWDTEDLEQSFLTKEDGGLILQENLSFIVILGTLWDYATDIVTTWGNREEISDFLTTEDYNFIVEEDLISKINVGRLSWNNRTIPSTNWTNRIIP